jgi:8-oxo-dGTP pyrophosphatase MutT (NUDIX family)
MSQLWKFCLPGDDRAFGYLVPSTVSRMPWTSEFKLDQATQTIHLVPEDSTDLAASSAAAMTRLLRAAQDEGSFANLFKWPGEKFPVLGAPFPFAVDRAIAPYFGVVSTGSQLTVFVRGEDRSVAGIWIARRADNKPTFPGKLDNAVGGAVNQSEMPFESLVREAREELGIDATPATSGGTISWFNIKDGGAGFDPGLVEPGVQFVYDLEVDANTVLHPAEAGIDWMRLLTIDQVKEALGRHEFKPSCACVMVEFFVRHGIINAENSRDFAEIVSRLHRRLPLPTTYPQKAA